MTGNITNIPTDSRKYQKALQDLYSGTIMPWDREILSAAPLPDSIVDPFASHDVDPIEIMRFAYTSLIGWISESKKMNYFSKRFVQLSKLVMNGINTMGRGLVTLHNRGEDLSNASMSIGDLISAASYQFRKSYLGAVQTSGIHPEIAERLLMNQLQWANMLLRLYKTKEKLESDVRIQDPGVKKMNSGVYPSISESQGRSDNSEGTGASADLTLPESFETGIKDTEDNSMLSQQKKCQPAPVFNTLNTPFSNIGVILEPGTLTAPRAHSSFGRSGKKENFRLAADRDPVITQTGKTQKEEPIPVSADTESIPEQNELKQETDTKTEPQTGEVPLLTEKINNFHKSEKKIRDQFPIRFDSG